MQNFKITLAYDGTDFVGWQRQASGVSIQGVLEDALSDLDGRPVAVAGAGRTDAGVHALGQVAGFALERLMAPDVLCRALNARVPAAVRVLSADEVPPSFNPRFDARGKMYRYRIWNAEVLAPFERHYAWHAPGRLDLDEMAAAARLLEGHHDFAAFQASGGTSQRTDRVVFSSVIARAGPHDPLLTYEVTGNGFLRHMVRALAGTLVEIGRGRHSPRWIPHLLTSRNRSAAGPTAPPQGLFLVSVTYPPRILVDGLETQT
jgi:tRNA pseudouridine38-40 synthase